MEHEQELRRSLDYIEENLSGKLRLEDISRIACLSKYHYHRLFRKLNGEPLMKYITRRRMARAASELVRTDARILDIAVKYQFSSQEAFTRAFKSLYGLSPGEYRKQQTIDSAAKTRTTGSISGSGSDTCLMAA
jgi:AraC-like DNA-binding protein